MSDESSGPVERAAADSHDSTDSHDAAVCPVCGVAYDSVSVHDTGLLVTLLDNERYRRVCFEPALGDDGQALVRFYHHAHAQTRLDRP